MSEPQLPQGVTVYHKDDSWALRDAEPRMALVVGVSMPADPGLEVRFECVTRRGSIMDLHDFEWDDENKVLYYYLSSFYHRTWAQTWGIQEPKQINAMTFQDFCFRPSDGSKANNYNEVMTPLRKDFDGKPVVIGTDLGSDLTQSLPEKFADEVRECMTLMNWDVLEGIMEHAILYGPFNLKGKEQ